MCHHLEDIVRDPVSRFCAIYENWDETAPCPLFTRVSLRCPYVDGAPVYVIPEPRRACVLNVLLVAFRLGFLTSRFQIHPRMRADFVYFFSCATGFYVTEPYLIPGYGVPRPWPEDIYTSNSRFYSRMRTASLDSFSDVGRVPMGEFAIRFGFLLQWNY